MRRLALFSVLFLLLVGCAESAEESTPPPLPKETSPTQATQATQAPAPGPEEREAAAIAVIIADMSVEAQVAQLFIVNLGPNSFSAFAHPTEEALAFVDETRAGGYILFDENITTRAETKALCAAVSARGDIPGLIAIDEEGGTVSRLSRLPDYENQPAAAAIGAGGVPPAAYDAGDAIGRTLGELGVHLDFAPCADVRTNPLNTVVGSRAYSADPAVVANMAAAFQQGLRANGILTCPKHFPGHGGTSGDSHHGPVGLAETGEELAATAYVPFRRLIDEGAEFLMLGHLLAPNADDSGLPASLSPTFVRVLREEMGFEGVITTDALNMSAITGQYSAGQAAVLALQAGVDMLLMPADYTEARDAVLAALEDGRLPPERLRESLARVLRAKIRAGLLEMG